MATKAQKVRLSIFLILSSTVLLVFFLVLVGKRILKRMDPYYIVYEGISVTGLEPGAAVKYHGVQVGRVADLLPTRPSDGPGSRWMRMPSAAQGGMGGDLPRGIGDLAGVSGRVGPVSRPGGESVPSVARSPQARTGRRRPPKRENPRFTYN